jgi:hypothetical protein
MRLLFLVCAAIAYLPVFGDERQIVGRLPVQDGVALIEVSDVEKRARKFLFDSGDPGIRLDPKVADVPGGKKATAKLNDSPGVFRDTVAWRVSGWKVGSHSIPDAWIVEDDLSMLHQFSGVKFSGTIGLRSLGECVVGLDFDKLTLYVSESRSARSKKEAPLHWVENSPCVRLELEGETIEFAIATGSNGTLSLPSVQFRKLIEKKIIQLSVIEDAGSATATGLSHERSGWFTKGSLMERNLAGIAVDEAGEMGEMGLQWLRAFNIEFSTTDLKFLYEERRSPSEPADWQTMLGANFEFTSSGPVVWAVLNKSAASMAGLQKGDRITSFDGIPGPQLTIENISELVAAKAGQKLLCEMIKSDGTTKTSASIQLAALQSLWRLGSKSSK